MTAETTATPSAPASEPPSWPTGGVCVLVLAEGAAADAAAGVARLRATLSELAPKLPGLAGKLLILDRTDSGLNLPSAEAELLRAQPSEPYGELLRRGLARVPTTADWLVRVPATGLDFAVLAKLLPRTQEGVVNPDVIVGSRPWTRSWSATAWAGWLSESLWTWLFGLVVGDAASPVLLLRRAVLADSAPQTASEFADHEFAARANFVGHLLDEYPLRSAWTGTPAGLWSWAQLRAMWADAYRVLGEPNFPRRELTEPAAVSATSAAGGSTTLSSAAARTTVRPGDADSRESKAKNSKRKNRRKK